MPALSPFILLTAHLLKWPMEVLTPKPMLGSKSFPVCCKVVWSTVTCLTSRWKERPPCKVILIQFCNKALRKKILYDNGPMNAALPTFTLLDLGSETCLLTDSLGAP